MTAYARRGGLVRLVYLGVATVWWVLTGFGRLRRSGIVVLCYHGVKDHEREAFAAQVRHAAPRAVGVDALSAPPTGRGLPSVCFTFDDAFDNLVANALPALREHRAPSIVFAVTGNLGRTPAWDVAEEHPEAHERCMTEEVVREVVSDGLTRFGSHSHTHPRLGTLPAREVREEGRTSMERLVAITGGPVVDLAFPHGSTSDAANDALFAAGYRRLHTLEPRRVVRGPGPDGRSVVGRFLMDPGAWPAEFRLTCAGAYEWLHHLRTALSRLRGRRPGSARRPAVADPTS